MATAPPLEDEELNIIRSPDVPFVSAIVGGVFPGRAIVVSGIVEPGSSANGRRFNIDLCCGLLLHGDHMDNKALHFNPRFDGPGGWLSGSPDRALVLNSYVNNQWETEERFDNPFQEGKPFQVRILVLEKYFKIAVNGKHVCDFAHRVQCLESIRTIYVSGNLRLEFIEFQPPLGSNGQVIQNPTPHNQEWKTSVANKPDIPFAWKFEPTGFLSPQKIQLTLTPFVSASRFTINLLAKGEHLLHLRVDMPSTKNKAAVVRNSTKNGEWQTEERTIATFPFNKGITHDVVLHAYGTSVAIDVDSIPLCKFNYRSGDSALEIDTVTVVGDLILQRFLHKTHA
ncbi:unnamed protein product [Auanema sp. JU1783]|nr:unnamed protein product [Auanema sp. JU1783]